ncbi:hypothetical protein [Vibrio algarum]|uniref:DNA-binding protein n=1 Tax=Vibrio algarum TaxID=3020714 RepID=A0ABT4YVD3_9VIBR|nr:hypothetical protein [Vibrio sp. KJ40-1]MDB1124979.1 hypothetical protein [Vibrio sp. KJ40-1]
MKKFVSLVTIIYTLTLSSAFASQNVNLKGTVVEAMNSGGYAYVLVELESEHRWFAGPSAQINVGDVVSFNEEGIAMTEFHSKSLNRDFDVIYFVNAIQNGNTVSAVAGKKSMAGMVTEKITPAEGGQTLAEIVAQKEAMSGKTVMLRGKVVKFSPHIMKTNWLHIQDGTSDAVTGVGDLTITTSDSAKVGDIVTITGKLTLNKDFGYGYKYDLIIEDATVVTE